jgi:protein-L-isoaspartate O-methyltransferase
LLSSRKTLDVGSGSGYLTLAFAKLMDNNQGISFGVEHIPELVKDSIENISK